MFLAKKRLTEKLAYKILLRFPSGTNNKSFGPKLAKVIFLGEKTGS